MKGKESAKEVLDHQRTAWFVRDGALVLLCTSVYFLNIPAQAEPPKPLTKKQIEIERQAGFKGEYFLTRSEDPVCAPFTKNLNQFRKLDFDECAPRLSENYPEFLRPEWKEVPLDLEIAEKAFKDVSMAFEESKAEMDQRWGQWLQETAELRAAGQVKMWITEADINNDGIPDPIARVQFAHPASSLPIKQRGCVYSHSGLWKLSPNRTGLYKNLPYFFFGRDADIIYSSKTDKYYSVEWSEGQAGPMLQGREMGATRGVLVRLAPNENFLPVAVCYINWVPTGKYRPLQRKRSSKHSN